MKFFIHLLNDTSYYDALVPLRGTFMTYLYRMQRRTLYNVILAFKCQNLGGNHIRKLSRRLDIRGYIYTILENIWTDQRYWVVNHCK